jgi:hypothetical protein
MRKRSRTKSKLKAVTVTSRERSSRSHPTEPDANQSAFNVLQEMIARTEGTGGKNPLAVALGRLGGLKGGRARADSMTKEERRKSAIKAAKARWSKL